MKLRVETGCIDRVLVDEE
ncbi:hypothetical protein PAB7382 [Pyrococcus abyssi GE5]|uniref:Uncharacterized protein n=1 Tax=Pyrococcus abyssi (strain GE5 / Orsay) TaxID=272844 RepID=Q9UYK7_PYRAB|nr:hypothetical protein PAB7382 [Pyrococcus abyssi GE5]CCE70953.1 TPA: hypothetical protein PAB7382 [Pyrococcus abyssi GE5]